MASHSHQISRQPEGDIFFSERHLSVCAAFQQGKFVVQKSQHLFSKISLDHNHEQENEMIEGEGATAGHI